MLQTHVQVLVLQKNKKTRSVLPTGNVKLASSMGPPVLHQKLHVQMIKPRLKPFTVGCYGVTLLYSY